MSRLKFANKKEDNSIIIGSDKKVLCDFFINNFVDIITTVESLNSKKNYFDIENLHKKFAKPFLNKLVHKFYTFDKYKSSKQNIEIIVYAPQLNDNQKESIVKKVDCGNIARNLLNEPSNKSSPEIFCNTVRNMLKKSTNMNVKFLNHKMIKKERLGLIDAIGGSSSKEPRVLIIEYTPDKSLQNKTICLIGKGVTIDTGGYSIKPKAAMYNMHMDKTGAAICVGLIKSLSDSKFNQKVIAVIPLVENVISDISIKPADVITAYNGQTVEIVDVDAEGRLILADALSYACKKYEPDYIFDFATLTGWSEHIHCHTSFTFFTTNNKMSKKVTDTGESNAEKSLRIPAWTEYSQYLISDKADVKNFDFPCKNSDGFMASIFLMNFIPEKYRKNWIHFDIKVQNSLNTLGIADGFFSYLELLESL